MGSATVPVAASGVPPLAPAGVTLKSKMRESWVSHLAGETPTKAGATPALPLVPAQGLGASRSR